MITCEKCREELAAYALGSDGKSAERAASSPTTPAAIAEHLRACTACRAELAEIEAAWSALPLALEPIAPTPDLFDRILARIDGRKSVLVAADASTRNRPSRRERVLSYILAASVLIGLTAAYVSYLRPGDVADAEARRSVENLARRLGNLQQIERLLESGNVRLVSLKRPDAPDAVEAYVVWDMAANQWHFYAYDLPPAPGGRTYQLWAADDAGDLLPGPTFSVNDEGMGSAVLDLPAPGVAARAIVTLEPQGGSKKPTGKVLLEAKF